MHPWLLDYGPLSLPSYFTLLIAGFSLVIFLAWREAPRVGVDADDMLDLGLYMLIGGLLGARILHVLADGFFMDYVHLCTDPLQVEVPSFVHVPCGADADCVAADAGSRCHPDAKTCRPARDCFAVLKFWQGGLAFYGGLILATAWGLVFIRKRGMPLKKVLDVCAWGIALGLVFGRAGCFLAGCCFGHVTEAPVGIEFPGYVTAQKADGTCPKNYDRLETESGRILCGFGSPAFLQHAKEDRLELGASESLPVHPTQLYESVFALTLFAYLFGWRRRRVRFDGQVWWECALWYGVGRFVLEFYRSDDRGLWFADSLSTSQLIAIPIAAASLWALWHFGRVRPAREA